jgi:nucleotide-binding universal stress UspA family protein
MPGILVGVDGSGHSRRALGWAMHEAARRHAPLTVMMVRPDEVRPATQIFWGVHDTAEKSFDPDHARAALREWVDKVAQETGDKVPDITVNVVTGDVAEELLKESSDADMLVVGSRGNGGFTKLLLGSVASKVAHHATGPVVVVPEPPAT